MNDPFNLPVTYKGTELGFPAQLLQLGYLHKFQVDVNGQMVMFEPDEDRNYRAIGSLPGEVPRKYLHRR